VTLHGNGDVSYDGMQAVAVLGRRKTHIEPTVVANLIQEFESFEFHDGEKSQPCIWKGNDGRSRAIIVHDANSATISVNHGGKQVEITRSDYPETCPIPEPENFKALALFEDKVDMVANTKQWTQCDGGDCTVLDRHVRNGGAEGSNPNDSVSIAELLDAITVHKNNLDSGRRISKEKETRIREASSKLREMGIAVVPDLLRVARLMRSSLANESMTGANACAIIEGIGRPAMVMQSKSCQPCCTTRAGTFSRSFLPAAT
jgi:hypothetical protein